jgi:hypothetical protein
MAFRFRPDRPDRLQKGKVLTRVQLFYMKKKCCPAELMNLSFRCHKDVAFDLYNKFRNTEN